MYGQINLSDASLISFGDLPEWMRGIGITDAQLADLNIFGMIGVGYWPIVEIIPVFDPATQILGGLQVGKPDARLHSVPATYAVLPKPPPPVPASISDRQFATVLAKDGVISEDEALAWAARGDLPDVLDGPDGAISKIPDTATRFEVRMMLSSATFYERANPKVPLLAAILVNPKTGAHYTSAELDDIWRRGALV